MAAALTLTANVQLPLAGNVPPVRLRLVAPPTGKPPVKLQVVLTIVNGVATTTPTGSVSVRVAAVIGTALGLVRVNVSVLGEPGPTNEGTKVLAIVGLMVVAVRLFSGTVPITPESTGGRVGAPTPPLLAVFGSLVLEVADATLTNCA